MKTFLDLAQSRHSVRKYENKGVELDKLNLILEAGRIAPTAANQQPCNFLVLNDKEALLKLNAACNPHGAPLAIITCANKNTVWVRPFDNASMVDIDATIATDHMMLAAQDLGLGSCWITYFDPVIVRKQFNIPENFIPVNILAIGYAAESAKSSNRYDSDRKPLESIVKHTTF